MRKHTFQSGSGWARSPNLSLSLLTSAAIAIARVIPC